MKIVIAPQAFKGCASAKIIAEAIAAGVSRAIPGAKLALVPIADGGDGTFNIILETKGGIRRQSRVCGPLQNQILADWGIIPTSTAVIELARICGLGCLPENKLNPLLTSTNGVGELIKIALDEGITNIFIGLGGSATNDAGTGLAKALGVRFLNGGGQDISLGGGSLSSLQHIDMTGLDSRLNNCQIIAGCDVTNPLVGPQGATAIYAPQKGATKEMVDVLERGMEHFVEIVLRDLSKDISKATFGGAAGGAAAGLKLFLNAKLVSGAEWILDAIGFDAHLENADLVIIGEGCIDAQTISKKAPFVAAQAARARNIPVIAIGGTVGPGYEQLHSYGIDVIPISHAHPSHPPKDALKLIAQTSEEALRSYLKAQRS